MEMEKLVSKFIVFFKRSKNKVANSIAGVKVNIIKANRSDTIGLCKNINREDIVYATIHLEFLKDCVGFMEDVMPKNELVLINIGFSKEKVKNTLIEHGNNINAPVFIEFNDNKGLVISPRIDSILYKRLYRR